eukprot:48334-Chlamydomonas_euryale.AAC.2
MVMSCKACHCMLRACNPNESAQQVMERLAKETTARGASGERMESDVSESARLQRWPERPQIEDVLRYGLTKDQQSQFLLIFANRVVHSNTSYSALNISHTRAPCRWLA